VSIDTGQLNTPMPGIRCQNRSGRPRSTTTNPMHIAIAAMASISPTITTSCISSSW
jgi:hypothetical protein